MWKGIISYVGSKSQKMVKVNKFTVIESESKIKVYHIQKMNDQPQLTFGKLTVFAIFVLKQAQYEIWFMTICIEIDMIWNIIYDYSIYYFIYTNKKDSIILNNIVIVFKSSCILLFNTYWILYLTNILFTICYELYNMRIIMIICNIEKYSNQKMIDFL